MSINEDISVIERACYVINAFFCYGNDFSVIRNAGAGVFRLAAAEDYVSRDTAVSCREVTGGKEVSGERKLRDILCFYAGRSFFSFAFS